MNCHFPGLIVAEVLSCSCLDSTQGKMIMQDRLEKERNDAKNNVEEYVYDMRDKLHGMLEKFVSESVSKPSLVFFFSLRYMSVFELMSRLFILFE